MFLSARAGGGGRWWGTGEATGDGHGEPSAVRRARRRPGRGRRDGPADDVGEGRAAGCRRCLPRRRAGRRRRVRAVDSDQRASRLARRRGSRCRGAARHGVADRAGARHADAALPGALGREMVRRRRRRRTPGTRRRRGSGSRRSPLRCRAARSASGSRAGRGKRRRSARRRARPSVPPAGSCVPWRVARPRSADAVGDLGEHGPSPPPESVTRVERAVRRRASGREAMSAIRARVSTLETRVGRSSTPCSKGRGGFAVGRAGPPLILRTTALSSPAT